MKYSDGVKYYLRADEPFQLDDITLESGRVLKAPRGYSVDEKFISLSPEGLMLLKDGYPTDGPSGPTIDSKYTMRGAAGHDGGYELIRRKFLPPEFREYFDCCLYNWVVQDLKKWCNWRRAQYETKDSDSFISRWYKQIRVNQINAEEELLIGRAYTWYNAVINFAGFAADPKNDRKIYDTEVYT